ncbi:ribonuclease H-like domain-containing protein [Tanacetum coccineum]|uniref:Ribonuclease H-like domain-containing protein n=1 Tax=Tanacetum coccineum TaxID=301880 RepID=A0ABQ5HAI3_9ASTR
MTDLKPILRYVQDTRCSTSEYCVYLGDNLISWSSKRQPTVSRSSAEAEYHGVANVVSESCWLHNLLLELHFPFQKDTLVYCDNSVVYLLFVICLVYLLFVAMAAVTINALDAGNPLFLQNNDCSNVPIIGFKLTGTENYKMWSTAMKIALVGKNKFGFVDGTCVKPVTSPVLAQQWEKCNAIDKLEETYDKMDGFVIFNVIHKINGLKQGESSIPEYYHKLNSLWREFETLTLLPACTCAAHEGVLNHNQLVRLMQFLMGINDVYQNIRSNILARDPLPDVKEAFNVVSREESHRGLHSGSGSRANQHFIVSTKNMFNVTDISGLNLTVGHPNGTLAKISAIRNLRLTANVVLFDVLVVPEYNVSLMSMHKLIKDSKLFVGFDETKCYIQDSNLIKTIGTRSEVVGLYLFDVEQSGDLVYLDLWGPYKVVSRDGYKYFLTIVDDYSRAVWLSDNGTEFVNNKLAVFYKEKGIIHETSCAHTPQQNGILERKHRHLLNMARGLPHLSCLDPPLTSVDEDATFATSLTENTNISEGQHGTDASIPRIISDGLNSSNSGDEPQTVRKSDRVRSLPSKFNDYVMPSNKKYGIEKHVNYSKLSLVNIWIEAMHNEMEALFKNKTWVLVDLPPNRKTIGCKWLWKIKYKSSGEIERYKARLVAKGFSQRNEIDYEETFSPVVKMVSVRCIISLAVHYNWPFFQLDVNNAFLYEDLHEDYKWIFPPDTMSYTPYETRSCKLVKKSSSLMDLNKLLVLENKNGLCLSQRKYCMELLSEYGLLACKPVATPMQQNHMHSPLQSYFPAGLRVLKYLKQSPGAGIQFYNGNKMSLHAYSDADWAKCLISRKFVYGFCVYFCGNLVSWKSKKQATISSTSAIQIAVNPVFHEKIKHFEIDVHLVREKVSSGAISTVKINSAENIADVFTKGLSITQHKQFCLRLNLVDMFQGLNVASQLIRTIKSRKLAPEKKKDKATYRLFRRVSELIEAPDGGLTGGGVDSGSIFIGAE